VRSLILRSETNQKTLTAVTVWRPDDEVKNRHEQLRDTIGRTKRKNILICYSRNKDNTRIRRDRIESEQLRPKRGNLESK
jgi:hypothetical protein